VPIVLTQAQLRAKAAEAASARAASLAKIACPRPFSGSVRSSSGGVGGGGGGGGDSYSEYGPPLHALLPESRKLDADFEDEDEVKVVLAVGAGNRKGIGVCAASQTQVQTAAKKQAHTPSSSSLRSHTSGCVMSAMKSVRRLLSAAPPTPASAKARANTVVMREIGDGQIEIIDDEDDRSGEVYQIQEAEVCQIAEAEVYEIEEAEVYEIEESQRVYEIDESADIPGLGDVLQVKSLELHDSKEDDSKDDADLQAALAASLASLQHHASGVQVCYADVC
jgi:hypothetical protein